MKVLYINHSSNMDGAGKALVNIIISAMSQGIIPYVIIPSKGDLSYFFDRHKIEYACIPMRNMCIPNYTGGRHIFLFVYRYLRIYITNSLAYPQIKKIVKNFRPDLIHTNTGVIHFGSSFAKKYGIKNIWHLRELQTEDFGLYPIGGKDKLRRIMSESHNLCIAITKSVFKEFNLSQTKDYVVYDGVFSSSTIPAKREKQNYFLYVGSIVPGKGVFEIIDAFDDIANKIPHYELRIVGQQPLGTDIETLIQKKKHPSQIKYLGKRNDVYDLMSESISVIVASHNEGFGFVVAEAMLNGAIVIGRDEAGIKEQFDNGFSLIGRDVGIRFKTFEDLQSAILDVANKKIEDYNQMINDARQVSYQYTLENNTKAIIEIYHRTVE